MWCATREELYQAMAKAKPDSQEEEFYLELYRSHLNTCQTCIDECAYVFEWARTRSEEEHGSEILDQAVA